MRANLILLIVALLLAIPTWLTLGSEEAPTIEYEDFPALFEGFNPDNVGVVTVARRRPPPASAPQPEQQPHFDELVFFRTETGWQLGPHPLLGGLPIKDGMVESMVLDHLQAIRLDPQALDTASADREYLAQRHLIEDSALIITCRRDLQSQPFAELLKGTRSEELTKEPGAVQGYYVCRRDKPKEVVVYDPSVPWEPLLDASEWVKKVIYDVLMGDVESFRVKNEHGTVAFKKKAGSTATWVRDDSIQDQAAKDAGAVRQAPVTDLLEKFRKVTAVDFEGPTRNIEEKLGLEKIGLAPDKSRYEFHMALKDGQQRWLRIGQQRPNEPTFYAVCSESDFVFVLRDYEARGLAVDPQDLFDPAPPKKQPPAKEPAKEPAKQPTKKPENGKSGDGDGELPTTRKAGQR